MICVPITGPSFEEAELQIEEAQKRADLIELRIDQFGKIDLAQIKELKKNCKIPVIFTLRPAYQGGKYLGGEPHRIAQLKLLATIEPDYLDLEYTLPHSLFDYVKRRFPKIKIIVSYHDFKRTPTFVKPLLNLLQEYPADKVKIATMATSTLDALKLLSLQSPRNLAVSMGTWGQFTRILSPLHEMPWTFASLDPQETTAPGQLTVDDLLSTYHFKSLNRKTVPYGLLGDPVDLSLGHIIHNKVMFKLDINSVYVKMQTTSNELKEVIHQSNYLGFGGFSVTMPLKEVVLKYIDHPDPSVTSIGACNTIAFKDHKVYGFNTDGKGGLDALAEIVELEGKHLVIVGAGGAAKALTYEAMKRKMEVTVLNRTVQRAKDVAKQFGCNWGDLNDRPSYDLLINATPVDVDPSLIKPKTIVMDIRISPSPFLKAAQEKKCKIVPGYKMWINQAVGQYKVWFPTIPSEKVKENLEYIQQDRNVKS